jgi:toxin ParE1/3/4
VKRGFVLTPQAKDDLEEVLLGIAGDNPEAAERLRLEFYKGLTELGRSPGVGHYREDLLGRRYRFWNFYSYVVAYAWKPQPIHSIAVVHGKRDLAMFFSSRTATD